jgi:hypothetical protein
MEGVIKHFAEIYPQLYLNPDIDDVEEYKRIVRRGDRPERKDLSHYKGDERDCSEVVETPAGPVEVITLYNRQDYEIFVRNMMAAKKDPREAVPRTQGASTFIAFNWDRIFNHKKEFLKQQKEVGIDNPDWTEEFKRFTAVKSNYQDMLIVLSYGPYSNISANQVGLGENEWLEKSNNIRKYHECTHVICRKLYPGQIDAIWDELLADTVGVYAAYGHFEKDLLKLFLGIKAEEYIGGRLENYVSSDEDINALSKKICTVLDEYDGIVSESKIEKAFDIIPLIEEQQSRLWD